MVIIHFILNLTILVLYIPLIYLLIKILKEFKHFKQKIKYENKKNMYSDKDVIKNKYLNFSFLFLGMSFALVLSGLFNIALVYNKTFIIIILIMISILIDEYLYILFTKKLNVYSSINEYIKKMIYPIFAMIDILLLILLIMSIEYI